MKPLLVVALLVLMAALAGCTTEEGVDTPEARETKTVCRGVIASHSSSAIFPAEDEHDVEVRPTIDLLNVTVHFDRKTVSESIVTLHDPTGKEIWRVVTPDVQTGSSSTARYDLTIRDPPPGTYRAHVEQGALTTVTLEWARVACVER